MKRIAVLDIGGTAMKSGLWENSQLVNIKETPYNTKINAERMIEIAISLIKEHGHIDAVGISTAGLVDSDKGIVIFASNIEGYVDTNWSEIIKNEFNVPCFVENDVNTVAVAEGIRGAAVGYDNYICLAYGTGIGGSAVARSQILTGCAYASGEFGHMITHFEKVKEGNYIDGAYERHASTTSLVQNAKAVDATLTDGRKVFENMDRPEVKQVIDDWIKEIVLGLVSLTHIFNPYCIVLGGGVMKQPYIHNEICKLMPKYVIPYYRDVVIKQAVLGNTAGMQGIALIAEQRI